MAYDFNHMTVHPLDLVDRSSCRERFVTAGATLFRRGQRASRVFRSRGAVIHLTRDGPQGEPVIVHRVGPAESFAEASVFAEHYHCDAVVMASGRIMEIAATAVLAAFANPDFALNYNRYLARQVQAYRQQLEIVSIRSARDRVLSALAAGLLDGPVTGFAAQIGLTREAAYRALRQLVNEGLVQNPSRGRYELSRQP